MVEPGTPCLRNCHSSRKLLSSSHSSIGNLSLRFYNRKLRTFTVSFTHLGCSANSATFEPTMVMLMTYRDGRIISSGSVSLQSKMQCASVTFHNAHRVQLSRPGSKSWLALQHVTVVNSTP
jgi:hypothetical protein